MAEIDPRFVVRDEGEVYPQSRETPIHTVTNVCADGGMVVVSGKKGDQEFSTTITRREAILRARALQEMLKKTAYGSETRETQNIIEMFIKAVDTAKKQDGGRYTAMSVSMAMSSMDPSSPLFSGSKVVAKGHTPPDMT